MVIIRSRKVIQWGEIALPVWGLTRDWHDETTEASLMFSLAQDESRLWFIAAGKTPAKLHPQARPGAYVAELWRHDCAELFLAHAASGRYLEFNLAANGAWWSAEFVAPRERSEAWDIAFPEVATFAELSPAGGWMSAIAIPRDLLEARIAYGDETRLNVTFISGSPKQRFFSANKLPGDAPDFHQPLHFSRVQWHEE
jgi:hypothetical protein